MDQNIATIAKTPFAQEIAKTFVLTAAATAGTFAGFLAVGWAWDRFDKIRESRCPKETPTV